MSKRHRIEPWVYVRNLLLRLLADDPRLEDMLPDRWAAAHPEAILTHRLEESRAEAAGLTNGGLTAGPAAGDPLPAATHHG